MKRTNKALKGGLGGAAGKGDFGLNEVGLGLAMQSPAVQEKTWRGMMELATRDGKILERETLKALRKNHSYSETMAIWEAYLDEKELGNDLLEPVRIAIRKRQRAKIEKMAEERMALMREIYQRETAAQAAEQSARTATKTEQETEKREDEESGGACDCSDQLDSAGRICGARAASVRPGGREPDCAGFSAPKDKAAADNLRGVLFVREAVEDPARFRNRLRNIAKETLAE